MNVFIYNFTYYILLNGGSLAQKLDWTFDLTCNLIYSIFWIAHVFCTPNNAHCDRSINQVHDSKNSQFSARICGQFMAIHSLLLPDLISNIFVFVIWWRKKGKFNNSLGHQTVILFYCNLYLRTHASAPPIIACTLRALYTFRPHVFSIDWKLNLFIIEFVSLRERRLFMFSFRWVVSWKQGKTWNANMYTYYYVYICIYVVPDRVADYAISLFYKY